MESSNDAADDIGAESENMNISKIEENHAVNCDESALKISTFGFTDTSWKTDFVLIVEGTRLYVNKAILALASPVFDTMFQSKFKESSCDELELPGKRLRDVVDFLRYIYPNNAAQFTQESALNVLPLLEEYQVFHLKPRCETSLIEIISEETSVEELFRILQVAYLYNLLNLRKQCVKIACNKSEEDIDGAFENNPPPVEAAKEILEELNKKLRETVNEQKVLIDDISREASESTNTFKAKNIEQERHLDMLKRCLSADMKKNKVITLETETGSNWKESTTILEINTREKSISAEREVFIWNVPLVIRISEQTCQNVSSLNMEIRSRDYQINCDIKGYAIIVNRQPQGENETVSFNGSIQPGCSFFNRVSKTLMKISRIKDISKGFLCDGHIGIIVQIYMSEPNRG